MEVTLERGGTRHQYRKVSLAVVIHTHLFVLFCSLLFSLSVFGPLPFFLSVMICDVSLEAVPRHICLSRELHDPLF